MSATDYDTEYVKATIRDHVSNHVRRAEAKRLLEALRAGFPTDGPIRKLHDDILEARLGRYVNGNGEKAVRLEWDDATSRLRMLSWPGTEGRHEDEHAVSLEWDCLGPRWVGRLPDGEVVDAARVVIDQMMAILMR